MAGEKSVEERTDRVALVVVEEVGGFEGEPEPLVLGQAGLIAEDEKVGCGGKRGGQLSDDPEGRLVGARLVAAELAEMDAGPLGQSGLREAPLTAQLGQALREIHDDHDTRPPLVDIVNNRYSPLNTRTSSDREDDVASRMKSHPLPDDVVALDVDPEATDAVLLDAVVDHWHESLMASDERDVILSSLGVSVAVAEELRIGFSDRTLGNRLPDRQWKAGLALRSRLTDFGILRESGHEAFRGCLTVPITDPVGTVVGIFGRRTDRTRAEVWAGGLPGGVFNERAASTCSEVILVGSMPDALAVLGAGHEAVVGPGRPGGYQRSDLRFLTREGVRRFVLVGGGLSALAERIAGEGIECSIVSPGAPLAALLSHADERSDALKAVLDTARPVAMAGGGPPQRPVAPSGPPTPPPEGDDDVGPQVSGDATELHVSMGTHHWRVRGADRNKTPDSLRVALAVTDEGHGGFHLDTLDLCQAKARAAFTEAAAAELHTDVTSLRRALAEVLFATEAAVAARDAAVPRPAMTEAERADAMALLEDPRLAGQVVEDLGCLGVVGEETNLLVAYLATISRKAERPFGVVVQSSTAAGKSTLADAVCQLVPEEDLASYSAITGQALYYVGASDLAHKVLAVAEEQGAARASYALKLLVTEGRLSIASTGKDTVTGKLRTRTYEVAGPVALVLTTTATDIDPELANRLVVLGVDEDQSQTRAIHAAQRRAATLDGLVARVGRERIVARHRNAQRLLEALPVVISDAEALVFPDTATRHRRDHQKLLSLICASALLHQHQRTIGTVEVEGRSVRYVEATGDDVALGLRLAERVLARAGDDLAPQTHRLLAAAQEHVAAVAGASGVDAATVGFTRRELRELLGWSEHQVRMGLARLVALEYLAVVPSGAGRQHRYLLVDLPPVEPRDTPRPVRGSASRGEKPTHAGQTADPAPRARAFGADGRTVVAVGVDPPFIRGDGR